MTNSWKVHLKHLREREILFQLEKGLTTEECVKEYLKSCNDRNIFQYFNLIDTNLYQHKITGKFFKVKKIF